VCEIGVSAWVRVHTEIGSCVWKWVGVGEGGGGETCEEMPAVGRWLDGGAEDCSPSICENGLGVQ
jgi:hypothetical protein